MLPGAFVGSGCFFCSRPSLRCEWGAGPLWEAQRLPGNLLGGADPDETPELREWRLTPRWRGAWRRAKSSSGVGVWGPMLPCHPFPCMSQAGGGKQRRVMGSPEERGRFSPFIGGVEAGSKSSCWLWVQGRVCEDWDAASQPFHTTARQKKGDVAETEMQVWLRCGIRTVCPMETMFVKSWQLLTLLSVELEVGKSGLG